MSSILISIIARDGNGPLRIIADRKLIEHSDDHAEINALLAERQDAGDDTVLILFGDDSVARHWTRPVGEPDGGADVLGERPKGRAKAKAKKHAAKRGR
jgi:hypothetical protein